MRAVIPLVALVLSAIAIAAPSNRRSYKIKESIVPPRGWTKKIPAPPHAIIELRIALPQPNFFKLEEHLYEIRQGVCTYGFFQNIDYPRLAVILSMIVMDSIYLKNKLIS